MHGRPAGAAFSYSVGSFGINLSPCQQRTYVRFPGLLPHHHDARQAPQPPAVDTHVGLLTFFRFSTSMWGPNLVCSFKGLRNIGAGRLPRRTYRTIQNTLFLRWLRPVRAVVAAGRTLAVSNFGQTYTPQDMWFVMGA